jgi:hypothetical protein
LVFDKQLFDKVIELRVGMLAGARLWTGIRLDTIDLGDEVGGQRHRSLACRLSLHSCPLAKTMADDRPTARAWPLISRVRQATDTAQIERPS